ncbi:uncharacterized protein [Thunnus thynnus]|uniref:uncharacterized protein isoform X2 n=1 Tax=Thunnus thynnus TaxID=8237 RepID=UPI003526EB95
MGGGLILSVDCRSDSPGQYGTYSLIKDRINKSSEVPNSTWCEVEGLKRSIEFLKEQQMQLSALITDRNRQVAGWLRERVLQAVILPPNSTAQTLAPNYVTQTRWQPPERRYFGFTFV